MAAHVHCWFETAREATNIWAGYVVECQGVPAENVVLPRVRLVYVPVMIRALPVKAQPRESVPLLPKPILHSHVGVAENVNEATKATLVLTVLAPNATVSPELPQ